MTFCVFTYLSWAMYFLWDSDSFISVLSTLRSASVPIWGLPSRRYGKESACPCRRYKRLKLDTWDRRIPWRRKWQSTLAFLPGELHGQRSLVGYSPWGLRQLDMTEHVSARVYTHTHTHTHIHTHVLIYWTNIWMNHSKPITIANLLSSGCTAYRFE